MTAVPLLDHHHGGHCAPRPSIFRRALRLVQRKPAVPEAAPVASGAAAPLAAECSACGYDAGPCTCGADCGALVCTGARRNLPLSADMPTGAFPALDAKVDAVLRRPVNGRSLGTQPRRTPDRTPVYGERPVADVLAAENAARAAGRCKPPTRELLGQVLAGLRAL